MDKTQEEAFSRTIEQLVDEGTIKALCPYCKLPITSMCVKKCEFCNKKIRKDNIILKTLPEKLD